MSDTDLTKEEIADGDDYIAETIAQQARDKAAAKKPPARQLELYVIFAWKTPQYRLHEWCQTGETAPNDSQCVHCDRTMGDADDRVCDSGMAGALGGWNDYKGGSGNFGIAMLKWQTLKAQGHNNCQVLNIHSGKLELEVYDA